MKLNYLAAALIFGVAAYSQETKTIKGYVYDSANNNQPLAFATVMLQNTEFGAEADENGYFEIKCNTGTYTLEASYTGYQTFTLPINDNTSELNIKLNPEDLNLDEMVITVDKRKSTETALLSDQRKSLEIKQQIGSQELSRKGVSDVAAAVVKTAGISKQEGSNNVYVRGLGDRYNSTTLNGLPIPSNDPEKKNINLELFSTDIVEYISIDKTFNSRNTGDFGGGNVDIISKDFKDDRLFEINLGTKINTNAISKSDVFALPQGPNTLGFASYTKPNNALKGFNFTNSLQPKSSKPIGGNFGLTTGKTFNIGNNGKLNLFATASFDNGFTYREGLNQSVSAQGAKLKSFQQQKFSNTTNTTGMFNANYLINQNNKIAYNFLYVNSSDLSRDIYNGTDRDFEGDHNNLLVQRGTFTQNTIMLNQLLGNHKLTNDIDFDWGVSYNTIESDMPDRTQNKLFYWNDSKNYNLAQRTITDNHRYFQNLTENELALNLALNYKLGVDENGDQKGKLTIGYNGRVKKRDFEAIQYNFRISGDGLAQSVNPDNLDTFFNQQNYQSGLFNIEAFAGDTPQTYSGEQNINAAFGNIEYKLTDKFSAIVGLRFEKINQSVQWRTQLDAEQKTNEFNRNEILPNLSLKHELNSVQNLRFAASKTYTLPQFKERARFIYEDVTEIKVGNPYLYPSQNYNFDVKWELFPTNDEIISFTAFGKYIQDPINEITMASATNDITWVNIGDKGYAYGAEFEIKKRLIDFNSSNESKLVAGLNVSYMKTDQEIDRDKVQRETNGTINTNFDFDKSSFTGASDLLLNTDISYITTFSNERSLTSTLAYNYYSDRLYALGSQKGNLVDKGMGTLDFILKTNIHKNLAIDFAARNILNPEFKRVQENASGPVDAVTYKRGAFFSLGAKYTF